MVNREEKGIMKYAFAILTNKCNLACTYCYEKNKSNDRMTYETLINSIDMIFSNVTKEDDKGGITFFGGEPTLEMDLILDALKYIGEKQKIYRKILENPNWKFKVGLITNGVIFNEKMVEYIDLMKFYDLPLHIQLSIDGTPECQDMYRTFPDGTGSSEIVFKNLKYYMELVRSRGFSLDCISVHPCLNKRTLPKLYEMFEYYIDLGFDVLWAMPVHSENWDDEDLRIYEEQLMKIYRYIENHKERDLRYSTFRCFDNGKPNAQTRTCEAAYRSFGINWNGDIYACHHLIFDKGIPIGNVIDGIDHEKLDIERRVDMDLMGSSFKKCKDCDYNTCYRCWAENRSLSGDDNCIPDKYCRLAYIEKKVMKFIEKDQEETALYYKPFKMIEELSQATNQLYDTKSFLEVNGDPMEHEDYISDEIEKVIKYVQEKTKINLDKLESKGGDENV